MKVRALSIILASSIFMLSCESDPCDEGFTEVTQNGTSLCLPDYVVGTTPNLELGNTFYSEKLGIITFKDGKWFDEDNEVINGL